MYHKLKSFFASLILLLTASVVLTGCVDAELKLFSGKKKECFSPTPRGEKLSWGSRFIQNTPIFPGTFKFKFDLDSLESGEPLPEVLLFTFTHKSARGRVLFTQTWEILPRDNGSIPFQTVNVGAVTVKKKESFIFDLAAADRNFPKSDFVFQWQYRMLDINVGGPAGLKAAQHWFQLHPSEYMRERSK